jgi:two-component system nitrogen regulation response regulator NtrX
LLIEHFASQMARREGVRLRPIAPEAVEALRARDWPGNVRELRNTVERLLILAAGDEVRAADVERLSGHAHEGPVADPGRWDTYEEFKTSAERAFLEAKLEENNWNVSETARKLEMPRSNLYKKIERYGLQRR